MRVIRSKPGLLIVWIAGLAGGFLAAALLPSVVLADPPSPLNPASQVAQDIANLFWIAFWIAMAIFILVEGLLLYTVIRFRQRKPDVIPPKIHGSTPLEIAWTAAPALILLMVFVLMVRTMAATAAPPTEAMPVKVISHQWWWEFQYPELGITTANELHVPVGQPILFD